MQVLTKWGEPKNKQPTQNRPKQKQKTKKIDTPPPPIFLPLTPENELSPAFRSSWCHSATSVKALVSACNVRYLFPNLSLSDDPAVIRSVEKSQISQVKKFMPSLKVHVHHCAVHSCCRLLLGGAVINRRNVKAMVREGYCGWRDRVTRQGSGGKKDSRAWYENPLQSSRR